MWLKVGNISTKISSPYPFEELRQECSISFRYYFKRKGWKHPEVREKVICLLKDDRFPTGWVNSIAKILDNKVKILDLRRKPKNKEIVDNLIDLRDYQREAVDKALVRTRGIINHPTGSGKTLIAAELIHKINQPCLYLVPSIELLLQTSRDLKDLLKTKIGMIGGGYFVKEKITVSTVASLWHVLKRSRVSFRENFGKVFTLIVDEVHHINKSSSNPLQLNTWFLVSQNIDAYWRYGFSATIGNEGTLSRRLLEATTGSLIHSVSSSELIDRGYLSRPQIFIYKVNSDRISEWPKAYEVNIIGNKERNELIRDLAWKYSNEGKTILINISRVEKHGKVLKEMIGRRAEFLYGESSKEERIKVKEKFKRKEIKVLIGTIYGEGVDIPSLDVVIVGDGGLSPRKLTQRIGRVLRISKEKSATIIIDFYDQDGGILERHSNSRLDVYKSEPSFVLRKEGFV